jgi:DNA modification methylase
VFPVDLPRFFIKLLCPPQGIVADPFAGSGTTGIAAAQEGMDFILIDNNLKYWLFRTSILASMGAAFCSIPHESYSL